MYETLNKINGVDDVKKMNLQELNALAEDIREALFNRLTKIGGHFGPNFGMVEAEIALHYVFNSPVDKIVFDVSHQSYPHKMLTGRKEGYICDEHFNDDSGYTNPQESEHDLFNIGHTSTSISLATGLAKARDILGRKENVIAIIGDGSLSGGEALEGLNVAGSEIDSNLIIVVNDNQQSISETHGGIYKSLAALRETGGKSENNIFKAFGLDYVYVEEGNDIAKMIEAFEKVKDIDHPLVMHINTIKGKGYEIAEKDRENWHWTLPFDRETGKLTVEWGDEPEYSDIAREYILSKAKSDSSFMVITPNMPGSMDLSKEDREALGEQFVDVGIAEEQSIAMAGGAAKAGAKPLVFTSVTFMQRAYDQISHDICINNLPITILLTSASFTSMRDVTHLGIFGIAEFSNIPNLVIVSPSSKEELLNALDWSIDQREHPVMILMPGNGVSSRKQILGIDEIDKFELTQKGERLAIIALGDFYQKGEDIAKAVEEKYGFIPTLINPRFASGVDKELLDSLEDNHELVLTLEDGILSGGFGQKLASYLGTGSLMVKNYGLDKKFYDRYNAKALMKELGMDDESILKDIKELLSL